MLLNCKAIYNRRNKLNENGTALIELYLYLNSADARLSTGVKVEPEFWDSAKELVSSKHKNHIVLNRAIREQIEQLHLAHSQLLLNNKEVSLQDVINLARPKKNAKTAMNFVDWCVDYIAKDKTIEPSTKRAHRAIILKIKDIRPNLQFSEINLMFVKDWDNYVRERGYMSATIWSQHKTLKSYINRAIAHDLLKENPYSKFKISRPTTGRLGLEQHELERLENYKYNIDDYSKQTILDIFLFACYTGIRFADLFTLTNENLHQKNNETILRFVPAKTQKSKHREVVLHIEILFDGKPKRILDKYYSPLRERIFPSFSNKSFNEILKQVCIDCGVRPLSAHLARHTFGSNLATVKPDPYLIMELMGLTEMNTALTYIHQSEARLKFKLEGVDWSLKK